MAATLFDLLCTLVHCCIAAAFSSSMEMAEINVLYGFNILFTVFR